jgi:hypothetical protein
MPYIGNSPGTGTRNRYIYTATASQTTFSGADDNGKTLAYSDGDYVDVFLNGICLVPVDDYTATSKTSIVLTVGAAVDDILEVVAYDIATIADTVSKANGGTFEGDVTFNAFLTINDVGSTDNAWNTLATFIPDVSDNAAEPGLNFISYPSTTVVADRKAGIQSVNSLGTVAPLSLNKDGGNIEMGGYALNSVQPRFFCYKSGSEAYSGADNTVTGWTENFDVGNNFNTSTERFTAPVDGTYLFMAGLELADNFSNNTNIKFTVNGNQRNTIRSNAQPITYRHTLQATALFELVANDYVELNIGVNSGSTTLDNSGWFGGILLA